MIQYLDEDSLKRILETFLIESNKHVQSMRAGLLEIEQASDPARRMEIVETIYRDAHSLKGSAGMLSRGDIESVSQALEAIFAQWQQTSGVMAPPETIAPINRAMDLLGNLLLPAEAGIDPVDRMQVTQIVQELAAMITASSRE